MAVSFDRARLGRLKDTVAGSAWAPARDAVETRHPVTSPGADEALRRYPDTSARPHREVIEGLTTRGRRDAGRFRALYLSRDFRTRCRPAIDGRAEIPWKTASRILAPEDGHGRSGGLRAASVHG